MHWKHKEKVIRPDGADYNEEIRGGVASWAEGDETKLSIKYTWFTANGRAARGGEVPSWALKQMLEFAKKNGYPTSPEEVA